MKIVLLQHQFYFGQSFFKGEVLEVEDNRQSYTPCYTHKKNGFVYNFQADMEDTIFVVIQDMMKEEKKEPEEFGNTVEVIFSDDFYKKFHIPSGETYVYNNITEVHYNYERYGNPFIGVAFESDIHGTGTTWDINNIKSFVVTPAKIKAEKYSETRKE